MIAAAIVATEIAFWMFLVAGLSARYVARKPRLGAVLLLGSPAADVLLLALTAVDIAGGATPSQVHAVAAVYLGFTVAFGHQVVQALDVRFAHRFAGGPAPVKPPTAGPAKVSHEWREFRRAGLAWAISVSILGVLSLVVGDVGRAQPLLWMTGTLTIVLAICFVSGPLPATLRGAWQPRDETAETAGHPGR